MLTTANALWGQKGYVFLPAYPGLLKAKYRAELRQVDFKGNPKSAMATINKWAEGNQRPNKGYLSSVDPITRLILTNAIYFKGKWQEQFEKENQESPFHIA